jgi:hypothetical protein
MNNYFFHGTCNAFDLQFMDGSPSGGMSCGQDRVSRDEHSMSFAGQARNLGEFDRADAIFRIRNIVPDYDRTDLALRLALRRKENATLPSISPSYPDRRGFKLGGWGCGFEPMNSTSSMRLESALADDFRTFLERSWLSLSQLLVQWDFSPAKAGLRVADDNALIGQVAAPNLGRVLLQALNRYRPHTLPDSSLATMCIAHNFKDLAFLLALSRLLLTNWSTPALEFLQEDFHVQTNSESFSRLYAEPFGAGANRDKE